MSKFYAVINPICTNMDFSFYRSEWGPSLDDGEVLSAEGDTAEEAWSNLTKAYRVGAHGRSIYMYPDPLGESYGSVHFIHELFTVGIPRALKERGPIGYGSGSKDRPGEDGCFTTTLLGNWEVEISISREPHIEAWRSGPGERSVMHGQYKVVLCANGDIQIEHKGSQIVWVDNHYMGADNVPDGAEHQKGLPSVVVNAVNQDEPSVCLSIGEDKVYVNDINWEITEDKRG